MSPEAKKAAVVAATAELASRTLSTFAGGVISLAESAKQSRIRGALNEPVYDSLTLKQTKLNDVSLFGARGIGLSVAASLSKPRAFRRSRPPTLFP